MRNKLFGIAAAAALSLGTFTTSANAQYYYHGGWHGGWHDHHRVRFGDVFWPTFAASIAAPLVFSLLAPRPPAYAMGPQPVAAAAPVATTTTVRRTRAVRARY